MLTAIYPESSIQEMKKKDDDTMRLYLYPLKVKCQENFKTFNFCCSDKRYKESHNAETMMS